MEVAKSPVLVETVAGGTTDHRGTHTLHLRRHLPQQFLMPVATGGVRPRAAHISLPSCSIRSRKDGGACSTAMRSTVISGSNEVTAATARQ